MKKQFVDEFMSKMRKGGLVAQVTPWMVEGFGDEQCSVRYVGLKLNQDWSEIINPSNNLLLKFIIGENITHLDLYLANKPPFIKIDETNFSTARKAEVLLGEFKRKLAQS